jgi:hypothetical protein
VVITRVFSPQSTVNSGQQNLNVELRLRNQGQATALIDSAGLYSLPPGIISDTRISALNPIPGGARDTLTYSVDLALYTGNLEVDGFVNYTDGNWPTSAYSDSGAVNPLNWLVSEQSVLVIDSVTISPSVVSAGQTGLSGSIAIANLGQSTARIDSVDLNFLYSGGNADTNFVITKNASPALPFNLSGGQNTNVTFTINTNSDALAGGYEVDGYAAYTDLVDSSAQELTSALVTDSLLVQTPAGLAITNFVIIPDTVSTGQDSIKAEVYFENTGQAPARIENGTIRFSSGNPAFIKVLDNPTLPYVLPGSTADALIFSIVAASSVTGDLQVDADVSGFDVNTLSPVSANAIDSILVQTGANPSWLSGSTIPLVIDDSTTTDFRLSIINSGEADIELDSTRTRFIISGTPYTNILLSGASPNIISGNDTTQLIFRDTLIQGLDASDYTIQINLVGTSNTSFYDNTINAGQVTIGGDIYFVGGEVTPSNVLLGQQGVVVEMIIGNQSSRLGIDNVGTTLTFERDGVPLPTPPTLTRTDALDTLEQIGDNRLYFTFDVPAGYPVDTIFVNGQISLDGGTIVKTSLTPIGNFVVSTGAKLEYLANSLSVTEVVPRQSNVLFRVSVIDTGSSNLTLIKDSTYIELGFLPEIRRTATSSFILNAGDTTLIDFVPLAIPVSIPTDADYSMTLRIVGIEVNGDTLIDTLTVEDLRVLSPANMIVTATDIVPLVVRRGQTDIEVNYTIENTGTSDGSLSNLAARFERLADSKNVAANWVLSELTPELPRSVTAGNSLGFSAKYVLNANADTGFVAPLPQLLFNDLRTPQFTDTTKLATAFDSVRVIIPAKLRTDSLVIATINPPRVNENQSFDLRYYITNTGLDTAKNIQILLTRNGADSVTLNLPRVAPASQELLTYNTLLDSAGTYNYFVKIDSAVDATTGSPVEIDQPLDNSEVVFVDKPAVLNYISKIVAPIGAKDSVVSIEQVFNLATVVTDSNSLPSPTSSGMIRLIVPANYTILGENAQDVSRSISVGDSMIWRIRADAITDIAQPYDTLQFVLSDTSLDLNIAQPAGVGTFDDEVVIKTITSVAINITPQIISPAGATDNIVSSGQSFTLSANIQFNPAVADTGRFAQILFSNENYGVSNSIKQIPDFVTEIDTIWNITAPSGGLLPQDTIWISVRSLDRNSARDTTIVSSPFVVQTITRSTIAVSSVILSPEGAKNSTLSTDQTFEVGISVPAGGQAGFIDTTGTLQLTLNNGLIFVSNDSVSLTIPDFRAESDTVYREIIKVPASGLTSAKVRANISEIPDDENSNQPVIVTQRTDSLDLTIVTRAQLTLKRDMPPINTLGTDQVFTISAIVNKTGQALLLDSGFVKLDLNGTGIVPLDALSKPFKVDSTISWQVRTPSANELAKVYVRTDTSTIVGPIDENDRQYAFRTAAAQVDSIVFDIQGIPNPDITNVKFVDGTVDSLTVATSQDSIQITATVQFSNLVDVDRQMKLILPAGYTTNDTSLIKQLTGPDPEYTRIWNIIAPQTPVEQWREIGLVALGSSTINPGLGVLSDTVRTLRIQTRQGARVILSVNITSPDGATDGEVSEQQTFVVQTLVKNDTLTSTTVEGDSGNITVTGLSQLLSLSDNKPATRKYGVEDPVSWEFQVGDIQTKQGSAKSDEMMRQIKSLQEQIGQTYTSAINQDIKLSEIRDQLTALVARNLTFSLDRATVPRDVNSLKPATVSNSPADLQVRIRSKAGIEITGTQYKDTVSSSQSFQYTAYFEDTLSVENAFATITLPAGQGFYTASPTLSLADSLIWTIRAPINLSSPLQTQIQVMAFGTDRNDGGLVESNLITSDIRVEPRAKVMLTKNINEPESAKNGFVSMGEEIIVTTVVEADTITGMAEITGQALVRLIKPRQFTLLEGDSLRSVDVGAETIWRLKAPNMRLNAQTVTFTLDTLPQDKNSGIDVAVDGNDRIASFAVAVRENAIRVAMTKESDSLAQSIRRGEENVALMAFEVRNPGDPASGASTVNIDSVVLSFRDAASGIELNSPAFFDMLESINLVNWSEYKNRMLTKPYTDFGVYEITDSEVNPLQINIEDGQSSTGDLRLAPGERDTIVVLVNLKSSATNRSFTVELEKVYAWDVEPGTKLRVEDSNGNLLGATDEFVSNRLTVIPDDPKETFRNYPNPFGTDYDETTIIFYLEDDSEVNLRIFTLTGDLVKSWQYEYMPAGLIDGQIKWDGRNDRGLQVLNGVYLCQIVITPKNGGSGQTYMTKIAYIK